MTSARSISKTNANTTSISCLGALATTKNWFSGWLRRSWPPSRNSRELKTCTTPTTSSSKPGTTSLFWWRPMLSAWGRIPTQFSSLTRAFQLSALRVSARKLSSKPQRNSCLPCCCRSCSIRTCEKSWKWFTLDLSLSPLKCTRIVKLNSRSKRRRMHPSTWAFPRFKTIS